MLPLGQLVLIDAVVHVVNEDYYEMATDFVKLVRSQVYHFKRSHWASRACRERGLLRDGHRLCQAGAPSKAYYQKCSCWATWVQQCAT